MLELKIGNKSSFIAIRVFGREHTNTIDYYDANWLTAEAEVSINAFSGLEKGSLVVNEFITFREELAKLHNTLNGAAVFSTLEEWINISITGNGRGNLELHCCLTSSDRVRLECKFDLDQTYLSQSLKQLDLILAEYPEIGSR